MMIRKSCYPTLAIVAVFAITSPIFAGPSGVYLEARTCQVYTGPCFANAETGLAGKDAIMAWKIESGAHDGVDLTGLSVVMVVKSSDTLGFRGLAEAPDLKSVVLFDERATLAQQAALISFVRKNAGPAAANVVRSTAAPINLSLDVLQLNGKLQAGKEVYLETRKAIPGDCICSNESAYYPPLAKVDRFVPGVTLEGGFRGRGLGSRWSIPDTRSSYMGVFGDSSDGGN